MTADFPNTPVARCSGLLVNDRYVTRPRNEKEATSVAPHVQYVCYLRE